MIKFNVKLTLAKYLLKSINNNMRFGYGSNDYSQASEHSISRPPIRIEN